MRALIVLAFALLAAAGPFDGPWPSECNTLPTTSWKSSCHVFGENHIFTFDGASYHPHMIGDYVLAKDFSGSAELHGRFDWCPGHEEHVACLTAIAYSYNGETVAFYYDQASDRLASTYDSYLVDFKTFPIGYTVDVKRREPDLGFHITLGPMGAGIVVMARFSQMGNSVSFVAPINQWNPQRFAGLCGTFDHCPYNDVVNMYTGYGVGWENGVNTWQVWDRLSLFEDPKFDLVQGSDIPPFVLHAPVVPYRWEPITPPTAEELAEQVECDMFLSGNVWEACAYEEALFGNHDAFMVGLYEPCDMFCGDSANAPITGFTDEKFNCSTFCDYQMDAAENLPDWIWSYPEFETPIKGLQVSETNYESEVFMMAPLGGKYTFEVVPDDCCHAAVDFNKTVVVNVGCENTVAVKAVPNFEVNLDEFWLPEIMVFADLNGQEQVGNNIHIMWTIEDPDGNMINPDDILNVFSLMPVFIPEVAGLYQLTVYATDGCSINYNKVNVTVNCLSVVWQFNSQNSDTIQWRPALGITGFSSLNVNLERSCLTPVPFTDVQFTTELEWLSGTPLSLRHPAVDTYILGWVHNVTYIPWSPSVNFTNSSVVVNTGSMVSGTNFHSPPPGYEDYYQYWVNRVEWNYDFVNSTFTETYWTNYTTIYQYAQSNECYLSYDQSTSASAAAFTWYATPAPDAEVFTPWSPEYENFIKFRTDLLPIIDKNEYFTIGECEGTYSTIVIAEDPFACNPGNDTFKFDVTCTRSPRAHTLTPCFDIGFDYTNHRWFSFRVWGEDVEELWRRELDGELNWNQNYLWFYDDVYQNAWNNLNPTWNSPASYTLVPGEFEGTHTITFRMNDGCNRDEETLTFHLICNYTVNPDMTTALGDQDFVYGATVTLVWNYDISNSHAIGWVDPYWTTYDNSIRAYVECTGIVTPSYGYGGKSFTVSVPTWQFYLFNYAQQTVVFDCVAHITDYCDIQDKSFQLKVKCTYVITMAIFQAPPATLYFDPAIHSFPAFDFIDNTTEDNGSGATNVYFTHKWYQTDPDGLVTTATTRNYHFQGTKTGLHTFIHEVYDGCMRKNNTGNTITLACAGNVPVARITAIPNTHDLFVENLPQLYDFWSNTSTLASTEVNVDWSRWTSWTLERTEISAGVYSEMLCNSVNVWQTDDCWFGGYRYIDFQGANPEGWMKLSIPIRDPVKYKLTLQITDGCKIPVTEVYIISTTCQKITTSRISASITNPTYTGGTFPVVCLNGLASTIPYSSTLTWRNVNYRYEIISAPSGSLFKPNDVQYTTTTYEDYWVWDADLPMPIPGVIPDPVGYKLQSHVTGNVTKKTHYVTRTYLKNLDGALTENKLGACFRPDVPGAYQVVLHLTPGGINCYYSASAPLTITAACNAAPVVSIAPTPISGFAGERITFTGIASDSNDDEMQYAWTLVDQFGNDFTSSLTNRHGKDVSTILDVGDYTLTFTVYDGCSMNTATHAFSILCPGLPLVLPKIDNLKVQYDGLGSMPMALDVSPIADGRIQHYTWNLVEFSPVGWDNGSFANYPALALLLLAFIVMWF